MARPMSAIGSVVVDTRLSWADTSAKIAPAMKAVTVPSPSTASLFSLIMVGLKAKKGSPSSDVGSCPCPYSRQGFSIPIGSLSGQDGPSFPIITIPFLGLLPSLFCPTPTL